MKKLLLTLMLAVVSSSVMAEWVLYGFSNGSKKGIIITVYADPATLIKSGNTVKMWSIFDYNKAQKDPNSPSFMSVKRQEEYDCKEEKKRLLYADFHSENMGKGDIVFNEYATSKWTRLVPKSISQSLGEVACGK